MISAVRCPEKGHAAVKEMRLGTRAKSVLVEHLDLADLASIDAFADRVASASKTIDVLINNAGLHDLTGAKSKYGYDLTVATNHIGTFHLTNRLLPGLLAIAAEKGEARVVNVASWVHNFAWRFDPNDPLPDEWPPHRESYGESKLANIIHTHELSRRYGADGLIAHSVHPGHVASEFLRQENLPTKGLVGPLVNFASALSRPWAISPAKGAKPSLFTATSEVAATHNGVYWDKNGPARAKFRFDPDEVGPRLWQQTEALIGRLASNDLRSMKPTNALN